jgi:hypothetical protein
MSVMFALSFWITFPCFLWFASLFFNSFHFVFYLNRLTGVDDFFDVCQGGKTLMSKGKT